VDRGAGRGATMIRYKLRYSEQYITESWNRYRRTGASRWARLLLKAFCLVGSASLFAFCVYSQLYAVSVIFLLLMALVLAGPRFDYWLGMRRLRKSPFFGTEITIELTPDEISMTSEHSHSVLAWSAFTSARRMPDGFLLMSGQSEKQWWPDSAIVAGSIAEAEALIDEKMAASEAPGKHARPAPGARH